MATNTAESCFLRKKFGEYEAGLDTIYHFFVAHVMALSKKGQIKSIDE